MTEPTPVFSLGRRQTRVISSIQRHRARNREQARPPLQPQPQPPPTPAPVDFKARIWCIYPCANHAVRNKMSWISGNTITSVLQNIRAQIKDPGIFGAIEVRNLRGCISLAVKNQRFVQLCRKLVRNWLTRRLKSNGAEDLVTGEVPKKPVVFVDWPARRTYTFEATTIRRLMLDRVLQSSYLFPTYGLPRNPYTNVDLTYSQYACVLNQLRVHQMTHWALEALLSCNYETELLKRKFGETIGQHIMNTQLTALNSPDATELVHQFIDDEHHRNHAHFCSDLYMWGLNNRRGMNRIEVWIKLCRDYYMLKYNFATMEEMTKEILRIRSRARAICSSPPSEIMAKQAAMFKQKLLDERARQQRVGGLPAPNSTE